jgi:hypothetical protein
MQREDPQYGAIAPMYIGAMEDIERYHRFLSPYPGVLAIFLTLFDSWYFCIKVARLALACSIGF